GLVLSALFMVADIGSGYQLREGAHFLTNFVFSYYNLEFAAGCWLGGLLSGSFKRTPLKTSVSLAMLLIGCLAFILSGLVEVYALRTGSENPGFVHYYEFVTYGLSSVLIVGGAAFLEKRHQIQINRALVILGAASFSIYLTHYSILSVLTKAIQAVGISNFGFQTVSMVLACAVAVFIGCIAHFYIEKRLVAILRNRLITKRL
ncbi:MAG: acyltransferase family protein, partial [Cyanobacteria bacterium P01_A01_bin.114]